LSFFVNSLGTSWKMPGLGPNGFLPNPLEFINHLTTADSVPELLTRKNSTGPCHVGPVDGLPS
jgi:hypothetical protein